jgi:hypothetical protein
VDFDPGTAVNSLTASNNVDGFVNKLDSNGNLIWVTHMKGGASVYARDLEIINGTDIVIMGDFTDSLDINQPTIALPFLNSGNREMFELILDTNGNFLSASKSDGSSYNYAYDIAYKAN